MPSRRLAAAFLALLATPATLRAERLPIPEPRPELPLRMTFQVLPPKGKAPVAKALAEMESVRLLVESFPSGPQGVWKLSSSLAVAGGDRHERVVLLIEEEGTLRQLGSRRITRTGDSPTAETRVFDSGRPNPLSEGTRLSVADDTYDILGLGIAMRALVPAPRKFEVHLWNGGSTAGIATVEPDGDEEIFVLGQHRKTKRFHVTEAAAKEPIARLWYAAEAPHGLLQLAGRAEFLAVAGEAPAVLLRASSSSEHSHPLLGTP